MQRLPKLDCFLFYRVNKSWTYVPYLWQFIDFEGLSKLINKKYRLGSDYCFI